MTRPHAERGTVLVQAVGGVLLVLATVLVLTDVAGLHLRRTALARIADDAALAGTHAVDLDALYEQGVGQWLPLDPLAASTMARASVVGTRDPLLDEVRVDDVSCDGRTVRVELSAAVPAPIGAVIGDRTWRIRAVAEAAAPTRW